MQRPSPDTAASFRIRSGRRGDAEAITSLLNELGYPNSPDAATVHWVLSHPEIEVIVAADALDKPVGVITLSHRPQLRLKGRIATIDELVVTASWRRKGMGRTLIRRAIERAKSLSVKRIELVTHKGRDEVARGFYESCGFTEADALVFRLGDMNVAPRR